jgi:hypothetical protein
MSLDRELGLSLSIESNPAGSPGNFIR